MPFRVKFLPGAIDDLKRLSKTDAHRIIKKCDQTLSFDPSPKGSTKKFLIGTKPPMYRLRVGDWRVFYEMEGKTVWILAVSKRSEAYRRPPR